MNQPLKRAAALAFTYLVLASCRDTSTEPEMAQVANPAPAVASNTWITRANMPSTERIGLTAAVVPNASGRSILYAIGGRSISTGGSLGKVQAYNVAANTWSAKASLPIAAFWTNGAGVVNGRIYISGGVTRDKFFRRESFMYNPATNRWTRKRDMPDDTWGGVTAVLGGKLYVLTCNDEDDCYTELEPLSLYRYDPATDRWTFLSFSLPVLGRPMAGFIGGKLYAAGDAGVRGEGNAFQVYDPATNQWTRKTPPPQPRWSGAGVSLGGKLYVIGGLKRDPDGTIRRVRSMSAYTPATDTWSTRAALPSQRPELAASRVVVNGQPRIEVVGGARPGNNLQYIP